MFSGTAFVLLIVLLVLQTVKLFRRSPQTYEVEQIFFLMAAVLLLFDFAYSSSSIGFPAVTNTYESLIFFSALICILQYVLLRRMIQKKEGKTGSKGNPDGIQCILFIGTIAAFSFLALAFSPLIPS